MIRPALFGPEDLRLIAICLHEKVTAENIARYVFGIHYTELRMRLISCGTSVKELLNNPIPEREC